MFYPYNKNQTDALFILSLFRQSTSACFGHVCSPSSGGTLYIYIYIYIQLVCWLGWGPAQHTVNYKAQHAPTVVYIYIQYTT